MENPRDRVKFNVGGRIFETTTTTLAVAGRNSLVGAMFDDNWNIKSDFTNTERFIDRNPDCFAVLLDLLRTGELCILPNIHERLLYREAMYYGILDHVRSAKWDTLDGNRLRLARSISSQSTGQHNLTGTIRAGPSSGCCVVSPLIDGGSIVKVYDWMLEEHPTIDLDYRKVNDVCWVDSENIMVSSDSYLGSGGLGLFSASTGKLKYKFQVKDELKDYVAGALGFSSDYKLFSSCKKGKNNKHQHGIGVWDQLTGKQTSFFHEQPDKLLGNASRLQLFNGSSCLMVASLYPSCCVSLLDFRASMLAQGDRYFVTDRRKFTDAIVIQESSYICVVDAAESLGFIDLRNTSRIVEWKGGALHGNYPYPKLAFHGGQLFSSRHDIISVYSGSVWNMTSKLQQSRGDRICDISIGGDRLFALHEEDVINVWETPCPPII